MTSKQIDTIVRAILSLAILGLVGWVVDLLFNVTDPTEWKEITIYVLGQVTGFAGGVVMYHFGSSAGSKQKTDAITGDKS